MKWNHFPPLINVILILNNLHIIQFKNYIDSKAEFSPRFNFITGLNGMGKTNLLDAIYYLGMTKSFFHNRDTLNVLHGHQFFRLVGEMQHLDKVLPIVVKVQPGVQKVFELDGHKYEQLIEHVGVFPMLMSAPSDTGLILDSSHVRRRFFDGLISQIDRRYLKYLMTYKKFLRQRNAGLKQKPVDFALMDVYTEKMGPAAVYICKKRKEIVQRILPFYEKYYSIFGSDTEGSTIQYDSQLNQVEFVDACKKSLNKDSLTGRTSIGIHRDDFKLLLNGFSARQFASQGQMKSILFALHLSKYEILKVGKEQTPIILLDDIFDKLDDRRVRLLMEILKGDEFGQIFITDTSQSRLRKIVADLNIKGYRFLEIQNGHAKVRPND